MKAILTFNYEMDDKIYHSTSSTNLPDKKAIEDFKQLPESHFLMLFWKTFSKVIIEANDNADYPKSVKFNSIDIKYEE
jgi:hypothetical protein